jgi:hypothetical protein
MLIKCGTVGSIVKAVDTFTSNVHYLMIVLCPVTAVSENELRERFGIFSFLE